MVKERASEKGKDRPIGAHRRTDSRRLSSGAVAACVALVAMAVLGGSSRYDAWQIIGLQPIAIAVCGFCLFRVAPPDRTDFRLPLIILGSLVMLMALQLVPLPQAIWSNLPGRTEIADVQAALGYETARPLSLVPTRTLHALFGTAIPACALLTYLALGKPRRRHFVVSGIVLLAAVNALIASLQLLGPRESMMYFYEVSNFGHGVGLFANTNHAAVFGALALIVIGYSIVADQDREFRRLVPLLAAFALVFPVILISGSRQGVITAMIALLTVILAYFSCHRRKALAMGRPVKFAIGAFFAIAVLVSLFLLLAADRIPFLEQFMPEGPLGELRWRILGHLAEMIRVFFPVGSGFGTFENAYYIFEPDSELGPTYLNMAHNDWAQFAIESGLPGLLVLAAAIWMLVKIAMRLAIVRENRPALIAFIGAVLIVMLASAFDYPLRAPLFQFVCVWLLAIAWDFAVAIGGVSDGREEGFHAE